MIEKPEMKAVERANPLGRVILKPPAQKSRRKAPVKDRGTRMEGFTGPQWRSVLSAPTSTAEDSGRNESHRSADGLGGHQFVEFGESVKKESSGDGHPTGGREFSEFSESVKKGLVRNRNCASFVSMKKGGVRESRGGITLQHHSTGHVRETRVDAAFALTLC